MKSGFFRQKRQDIFTLDKLDDNEISRRQRSWAGPKTMLHSPARMDMTSGGKICSGSTGRQQQRNEQAPADAATHENDLFEKWRESFHVAK